MHHLENAEDWAEPPFDGAKYLALLVLPEKQLGDAALGEVARNLMATGCRSVNIWGEDCWLVWEIVNRVARSHNREAEKNGRDFVSIGGLEVASAHEVAVQLLLCSDYNEHVFANFLVLFWGQDARMEEDLITALRDELSEGEELVRSLSPELQHEYNEIHQRGSQS
jgi:hypothetical protein